MAIVLLSAACARAAEPTFTNVTATVAPGLPGVANGAVAWGDYDNDGRRDFLLTGGVGLNYFPVAQLWRNTGSGFTNVTAAVVPGLPGIVGSAVAWGDYNNDGRLDFLFTGSGVAQLWRNTGTGFTSVTVGPGLPGASFSSAAWGDYDNDGRLDFLIAGDAGGNTPFSQLWHNTVSGFINETAEVAPDLPGLSDGSVAWGDFDNDGRLDLILTGETKGPAGNSAPVSQLWRNTGNGLANITAHVAPDLPGLYDGSVAWGDFDNDGRLDFILAGRTAGGSPISQLWRNIGNGFVNVTASVAPGLSAVESDSVSWADYDNDGRLDLLLTASSGSQLWRNTGTGFTNVTASVAPGLPGVRLSFAAWGDFDNDHRLDLLLTGSTNSSYSGGISQLWRNNTARTNPPPVVITGLPDSLSGTSASLNARINPHGSAVDAWFIWGDSTNYGQVTAVQPMGNGSLFSNFSEGITGLSAGVTYYYRAVGSNDQGEVFLGLEESFLFGAPGVTTKPAEDLFPTSATLHGQVHPNIYPTFAWFEWGVTMDDLQVTPVQSLGRGFGRFTHNLFELQPNSTYYFRAVAFNSLGVTYAEPQTLVTPSIFCPSYLSPTNRNHGYAGGSGYSVYGWNDCDWTIINSNAWVAITSPTNGPRGGPGTVTYNVAVNTAPEPRSGTVLIGGHILAISQAGGHAVIISHPGDQSVMGGGTATFSVTVTNTTPVTYEWQFNQQPLVDGNGVSGASTANLLLTNIQLSQAGGYRCIVTDRGSLVYSRTANLTVSCNFSLTASSATFNSLGNTGSVTVSTITPECLWSVANTNPWVTILSSIPDAGAGPVIYALAANTTGLPRSGNIVIAGQTFTINQMGGPPTNDPISLEQALDTEGSLEWSTIGTPAWFGQRLVSHDGADAAQSGTISDSAAVTAVSVITGPGTLSWWWKVSSETNRDVSEILRRWRAANPHLRRGGLAIAELHVSFRHLHLEMDLFEE